MLCSEFHHRLIHFIISSWPVPPRLFSTGPSKLFEPFQKLWVVRHSSNYMDPVKCAYCRLRIFLQITPFLLGFTSLSPLASKRSESFSLVDAFTHRFFCWRSWKKNIVFFEPRFQVSEFQDCYPSPFVRTIVRLAEIFFYPAEVCGCHVG